MTTVVPGTGTGYFSDPYPIHTIFPSNSSEVPTFAGTTKQLLTCSGALRPACFSSTPNTVDPARFTDEAAAVGTAIKGFENLNAYQDGNGAWHMAVTALITRPPGTGDWSVIMHAHPASAFEGVPTAWIADALLVGSLSVAAPANYDGKYFEDCGTLYLVYSMKLTDQTSQDGIVAQAMRSATKPETSSPVPLLGPENNDGGYNSELFFGLNQPNGFKLIETGNITKIEDKYVMAYSTGGYDQPDYKAGIAWSDSFLPPTASYYRRVQKLDVAGVWGQPNHEEVEYLLQSQESAWPNYTADQVLSPGVPSIVSGTNGNYFLFFAGYAPSDAPTDASGNYVGSHRRPFYIRLKVNIPEWSTVEGASPRDLRNWIRPDTDDLRPHF